MIEQKRQTRKLRGFTLIEVLVSVVIFSVGLLGLAGLQATGLKLNQSSMLRSQATQLAYDAVDTMRANKTAAMAGNYAIAIGAAAPSSPTNQAERDLGNWKDALSQSLPQGDGSITIVGGRATIVVQWDDSRGAQSAMTLTLVSDI